MAFKVFLSHSSADRTLVAQMRDVAVRLGCELYVYTDDVQGGRRVYDKVKEQIAASDAVLVLLTDASTSGGAVHDEVGIALVLNKPIIPVKAKGLELRTLGLLSDREWIEFDDADEGAALAGIQHSLARYKAIAAAEATIIVLLVAAMFLWWLWTRRRSANAEPGAPSVD